MVEDPVHGLFGNLKCFKIIINIYFTLNKFDTLKKILIDNVKYLNEAVPTYLTTWKSENTKRRNKNFRSIKSSKNYV